MQITEDFKKGIKWACIQPLTGGLYLGTEEAIGHPAEWIMSFDGLAAAKPNKKTGECTVYANEYNLLEYLKKKGRQVPYYIIKDQQFGIDINSTAPNITLNDEPAKPSYENLDLIVALPVCSGLSTISNGSIEQRQAKNCNMQFITNYTINVIRPKLYIFENAPTLMGKRGDYLRHNFNELAKSAGYSVLYYKTDTNLHDNCQRRHRTFVIFVKHNTETEIQNPPLFDFEYNKASIEEFLGRIPEGCTQTETVEMAFTNQCVVDFLRKKFGSNWRDCVAHNISLMFWLYKNNMINELKQYVEDNFDVTEKPAKNTVKYINHVINKLSMKMGYYGADPIIFDERFPSVQFKSMQSMLHNKEDRVLNKRELLSLMGMPYDFELYGNNGNMPRIGQNVPVKTMKFIVENAIRILPNWNEARETTSNCMYQNNINQKTPQENS